MENDLEPLDEYREDAFNVGNKILVHISTDDPAEVMEKAKQAAKDHWRYLAKRAKAKAKSKGVNVDENLWNDQIDDVLELYGAWKILEENGYKTSRKRLDQLLNARKNTRDFIQNPVTKNGIPKSSLDGLRENVIQFNSLKPWVLREAGLNAGEYLDCTGVIKRLGQNPEQFTPLSRLAVEPWLQGLADNAITKETKDLFDDLVNTGLCSRVRGNQQAYKDFPFDGQLLYPFRRQAEINKLKNGENGPKSEHALDLLSRLEKLIEGSKLHTNQGEPSSYMAILVADGDRVGKLLDTEEMQNKEAHRAISKALTDFATNVAIIIRGHQGHCIYAGGDDVLALLPLHTAIKCGHELAENFRGVMQIQEIEKSTPKPTLSVGLGISHFMTPMPQQLELARQAEKLAKGNELSELEQRNALAIIIQPRSGASISFREHWNHEDKNNSAETILETWIKAHTHQLVPRQAGYNLRDAAFAFDWIKSGHNEFIQQEVERIMGRKRNQDGEPLEKEWIEMVCNRVTKTGLLQTADELIMTYRIAQAYKLADKTVINNRPEETAHD